MTAPGRSRAGRFTAGNSAARGKGNPHVRRLAGLQEAVRGAISGDDLRAVLHALRAAAVNVGDPQAAKVLLDRVLGRAREESPNVSVELGDLTTASGIVDAQARIAHAAASGTVPVDVARTLADLVERTAEAGLLADLARRMAAIEGQR